jgi:hypothetical protein
MDRSLNVATIKVTIEAPEEWTDKEHDAALDIIRKERLKTRIFKLVYNLLQGNHATKDAGVTVTYD